MVPMIGIEEEYLVVDPHTRHVVPRAGEVLAAATGILDVDQEITRFQLEARTAPSADLDELGGWLRAARKEVAGAARSCGVAVVASGIPVIAITMLFGGVDAGAVWRVQLSTLLATVFAASHAIYFSTTTHSPLGALARTYFWLAVWLLGLPVLAVIILETVNARSNDGIMVVLWGQVFINPITSFAAAVEPHLRFFSGKKSSGRSSGERLEARSMMQSFSKR